MSTEQQANQIIELIGTSGVISKGGFTESDGSVRAVTPNYPMPVVRQPAAITGGFVDGWSVVHKFGHNLAAGTTFELVTPQGVWRTPQVSGATALRIKAGNANDTADGSGARQVTLQGLDETGALVSATLPTAGTSASTTTTITFLRLFRFFVSESGTYATQSAGSHAANIVIENAAGTEDWGQLDFPSGGFPKGQSYVGCYTVPLGYQAYVTHIQAITDSAKVTDLVFFKRENILETSAPYSPMRSQLDLHVANAGGIDFTIEAPLGPFPALTDIGMMAKVDTGSAEVDVNFEIWLRATD